jgi:hypothetical protein
LTVACHKCGVFLENLEAAIKHEIENHLKPSPGEEMDLKEFVEKIQREYTGS